MRMNSELIKKLFESDRSLPGEEVYLIEPRGPSETDFIDEAGTMVASLALRLDDGPRTRRKTLFEREVQERGRCLSSQMALYLQVGNDRLVEQLTLRVMAQSEEDLSRMVEAVERALNSQPASHTLNHLHQHLRSVPGMSEPEHLRNRIDSEVDRLVDLTGLSVDEAIRNWQGVVRAKYDRVKPNVTAILRAMNQALTSAVELEPPYDHVDKTAEMISAADSLIDDTAQSCEVRADDHRRDEASLRAALRLGNRPAVSQSSPPTPRSRRERIVAWGASLMSEFIGKTNQGEVTPSTPTAAVLDTELQEAIRAGVKILALTDFARGMRQLKTEMTRARRQAENLVELASALLGHIRQMKASLDADSLRFAGTALEDDERVIEELATGITAPSFLDHLRGHHSLREINPREFVTRFEVDARNSAKALCANASLEEVFGLLSLPLQDSLIVKLIQSLSVPLRKMPTAIWQEEYTFAAPGGERGPLGVALRRNPEAGRFRILHTPSLTKIAVGTVYVPFIKPTETVAFSEGREAMDKLRQSCDEDTLLLYFPLPILVQEPDPLLDEKRILELVALGIALKVIGASKRPAGPPFYLVNGHTGGRDVADLKPALKRTLPKVGNSIPDVVRTLARTPTYRQEIELAWRRKLDEEGAAGAVEIIRHALTDDLLSTAQLREAASEIIRRISLRW